MTLIKLCANRMTKELMAGNLSTAGIDKIRNFDEQNNYVSLSPNPQRRMLNNKINQKAKLIQPNMLRSDEQIASGLQLGNNEIAKKMKLDMYDLNDYSKADTTIKDLLDKHLRKSTNTKAERWRDSFSMPTRTIHGTPQKAFAAYDKTGKSLDAALSGRHELFEEQEGRRISKKVKIDGSPFFPKMTETHTGNNNGRIAFWKDSTLYSSGNHNTLGVLGKESTEMSRLFNKDKLKLTKN